MYYLPLRIIATNQRFSWLLRIVEGPQGRSGRAGAWVLSYASIFRGLARFFVASGGDERLERLNDSVLGSDEPMPCDKLAALRAFTWSPYGETA